MKKKLILLCFVLAGCNKSDLFDKKESTDVLTKEDLVVTYSALPEANKYKAELSWPVEKKAQVLISHDRGRVFESSTSGNKFALDELTGGEPQVMKIEIIRPDNGAKDSFDYTFLSPRDYVFDGVVTLGEDLDIEQGRVYFTKDARFYNLDRNLTIKADVIYSELGAYLANFPDGRVANVETAGMSGGTIKINARLAVGNLKVKLNGEKGGVGKNGWLEAKATQFDTIAACNPNSGANSGDSGNLFVSIEDPTEFSLTTSMEVAAGGEAGRALVLPNFGFVPRGEDPKYYKTTLENCANNPTNGKAGHIGQICLKMKKDQTYECK